MHSSNIQIQECDVNSSKNSEALSLGRTQLQDKFLIGIVIFTQSVLPSLHFFPLHPNTVHTSSSVKENQFAKANFSLVRVGQK